MIPQTMERRFNPVEIRAVGPDNAQRLVGRAVTYNQWSELLYDHFREQIAPGAFDESLASGKDVYASIDHDMNRLLGRMSAGTLELKPDADGIAAEVPLAAYSYARDLVVAIQRKDLRGMSFIFDVTDDKWETRDGTPHRTVTKADLYEVSYVFFPAYPQTEAGVRMAFPVAGEQRAIQRAKDCGNWRAECDRRAAILRLKFHR